MKYESLHLKINLLSLMVIGIWPLDSTSGLLNASHKLYSFFVIFYFLTFVTAQWIEIFNIIGGNLFDLISNLSVSILYLATIIKYFICKSDNTRRLVRHIHKTEANVFEEGDSEIVGIYNEHVKLNHRVDRLLLWTGVFTILPFYVTPVILERQNPPDALYDVIDNGTVVYRARPLPLSSWFPFDRYKYYSVAYFYHIVAGMVGTAFTAVTDIMFYGLIIFGIGQIKILQHRLRFFAEYAEEYKSNRNCCSDEEAHTVVIWKCIAKHKEIIEYVKGLDGTMRYLMLIDFALASVQMATLGFKVISSGFGVEQLSAIEYLGAMFLQLFLFYWHANEVLLESENVKVAVWNSKWYEADDKLKRTLRIIMMRASKPLTLSVGPFYAMSTQTALAILRASYSYVAVLYQTQMRKVDKRPA